MLKEVGASGQISLGKKFAGQLFDVQFLDNGMVQMLPVKVVPQTTEVPPRTTQRAAASATATDKAAWELDNQQAIEAFQQRMLVMGSPAQRRHAWRSAQQQVAFDQNTADDADGAV